MHLLRIDLFVYPSLHLSVYLSVYLFIYRSIYLSVHRSIYLPTYLAIYLSTYLPIYLPTHLPTCYLPIYLCISVFFHTGKKGQGPIPLPLSIYPCSVKTRGVAPRFSLTSLAGDQVVQRPLLACLLACLPRVSGLKDSWPEASRRFVLEAGE